MKPGFVFPVLLYGPSAFSTLIALKQMKLAIELQTAHNYEIGEK